MDEYRANVKKVQKALNQDASFIRPNPYLAQRVLSAANKEGGIVALKKRTVAIAIIMILMLSSLTAFAAALLVGHDVKLYEGVEIKDLLPDQQQEYDVCHRLNNGYLVGGFSLEDDYIAPMDENDVIVMLDSNFRVQWTLSDSRLEGCLFDKIFETSDALYMGLEYSNADWVSALIKIGLDGTIHWFYMSDTNLELSDFVVDSQGNTICVGSVEVNDTQKACVIVLDQNGKVEEKLEFFEAPISSLASIRIEDSHIIVAGYGDHCVWIGEMNLDGELAWQETVELEETVQSLRLQTNEAGDFVMSIVYRDSNDTEATKHFRYYVVNSEILK